MVVKISANVEGSRRISALFTNMERRLSNYKEPLTEANQYMRKEIDRNFSNEGGVFDNKWEDLDPKYEQRKRKKYGDQKMLQATGKMRASFKSKVTRRVARIKNTTKYFKYHQSKKPRTKIPRRVMMEIGRTQQAEIFRFFTKYVNKVVNNG